MEKLKTYQITKQLTNEAINQVINNKHKIYTINEEAIMMLIIAITKFIEIKQDIVTKDKNKKQNNLSEQYPNRQLHHMVFKGYFKILDNPHQTFLRLHKEKPIKIYEIKQGKEKDASWIIDNIRDALAHNHFELDYEKQVIHIINQRPDRKLICDIDFYWMIRFYFILGNNRIENNYPKFTLEPLIYYEPSNYRKPIQDITQIDQLFDDVQIITMEVEFKNNIDKIKMQQIKLEIKKSWNKITQKSNYLEILKTLRQVTQEIHNKYKQYIKKMGSINISEDTINQRLNQRIQETPNFFNLSNQEQTDIILKNIGLAHINNNPKNIIEIGLDTIMSGHFMAHDEQLEQFYQINPEERTTNKYCYSKEKLIALLYVKGVINFVLHKESIYDKSIDYDDIDISKFKYYDYGKILKLKTKTEELKKQLESKQKELQKQHEIFIKKQNAPEHKKEETKQKIEQLKTTIEELETLQKNLVNIINNSPTDENNKPYQTPTNQEFFTHMRNALAHTWIKFKEPDNTPLNERLVEIEDYNDNKELVFMCYAKYSTWIELLDNEIFLNAIEKHQNNINMCKNTF